MFDATRAGFSDSARQALRIFISSTAIDLKGYRDKVREAIPGLGNHLPIAMETFSAFGGGCGDLRGGAPVRLCAAG
jgi:hypothetical protein